MENSRNIFDITFETDQERDSDSDSDISLGSDNESDEINSDSESENENVENVNSGKWKVNDRSNINKRAFSGPVPGPTVDLDPESSEFDFFELFFPLFLIEVLCRETNLYATQKQRIKPDPLWRPVTEIEMRAWLGIRVYMSILEVC